MASKRFEVKETQGVLSTGKIIVDTQTGVNYLFWQEGYAGGLTPLLDRNGNVVVDRVDN